MLDVQKVSFEGDIKSLEEVRELAKQWGYPYVLIRKANRPHSDAASFLSKSQRQELIEKPTNCHNFDEVMDVETGSVQKIFDLSRTNAERKKSISRQVATFLQATLGEKSSGNYILHEGDMVMLVKGQPVPEGFIVKDAEESTDTRIVARKGSDADRFNLGFSQYSLALSLV